MWCLRIIWCRRCPQNYALIVLRRHSSKSGWFSLPPSPLPTVSKNLDRLFKINHYTLSGLCSVFCQVQVRYWCFLEALARVLLNHLPHLLVVSATNKYASNYLALSLSINEAASGFRGSLGLGYWSNCGMKTSNTFIRSNMGDHAWLMTSRHTEPELEC